jgi:hypothetical protein
MLPVAPMPTALSALSTLTALATLTTPALWSGSGHRGQAQDESCVHVDG